MRARSFVAGGDCVQWKVHTQYLPCPRLKVLGAKVFLLRMLVVSIALFVAARDEANSVGKGSSGGGIHYQRGHSVSPPEAQEDGCDGLAQFILPPARENERITTAECGRPTRR